jgi:uncharacterized protein YecE (DUF72 family)
LIDTSKIRIGCVSWTYPDWLGSFYPKESSSRDFLSLYSKVFDIVEIDATFYRLPTNSTVKQWREKTGTNFLFTAKLPKKISHDSRLKDVSAPLKSFEAIIKGLGPKLACVMTQLPPNMKFEKSFSDLEKFLRNTDPSLRYAVEFRDKSWYRSETYNLLKEKGVTLVWYMGKSGKETIPEVTSDLLYLRFMGQFGEFPKFDHVQEDKTQLLKEWISNLGKVSPERVKQIFVLMSNHFEGFAPSTANSLRRLLGLPEVNWKKTNPSSSGSDFTSFQL